MHSCLPPSKPLTVFFCVAAMLCAMARAPAAATAPATSQPTTAPARVDTLIQRLSADDWRSRQEAQDELARLGEAAVPALQHLAKTSRDPDLVARAQATLREIEQSAATRPSLITLHYRDADPATVFRDVFAQAQAQDLIGPSDALKAGVLRRLSIDLDQQPFWEAARRLAILSQTNLRFFSDRHKMELVQGKESPLHANPLIKGPFLLAGECINSSPQVTVDAETGRNYQLRLDILSEPRMKLLDGTLIVNSLKDGRGEAMTTVDLGSRPRAPVAQLAVPLRYLADYQFFSQLALTPAGGVRSVSLSGELTLVVQVDGEKVELGDIVKVAELDRTVGNWHFIIHSLVAEEDCYRLSISLLRDRLNPDQWQCFKQLIERLRIVDAQGVDLVSRPDKASLGTTRTDYSWRFYHKLHEFQCGPAAKLVWDLPKTIKEVKVPVEMRDLRME